MSLENNAVEMLSEAVTSVVEALNFCICLSKPSFHMIALDCRITGGSLMIADDRYQFLTRIFMKSRELSLIFNKVLDDKLSPKASKTHMMVFSWL